VPRALKILAWASGALVVLPIVLISLVIGVANMDWGRRLIEQATARGSGGQLVVAGLSGRFPDDLHLTHAEVRDADAVWMGVDDLTRQWSPARLPHRGRHIGPFRAARAHPLRPPPPSAPRQ